MTMYAVLFIAITTLNTILANPIVVKNVTDIGLSIIIDKLTQHNVLRSEYLGSIFKALEDDSKVFAGLIPNTLFKVETELKQFKTNNNELVLNFIPKIQQISDVNNFKVLIGNNRLQQIYLSRPTLGAIIVAVPPKLETVDISSLAKLSDVDINRILLLKYLNVTVVRPTDTPIDNDP